MRGRGLFPERDHPDSRLLPQRWRGQDPESGGQLRLDWRMEREQVKDRAGVPVGPHCLMRQ